MKPGRALLVFPLPRPREATLGTSPAGPPVGLDWTVNLRAFWNPAFAVADTSLPASTVPKLR